MRPFTRLVSVLLALVALAHVYRVVRPFSIVVAGDAVPQWASVVGIVVAGGLSLMLWREARG